MSEMLRWRGVTNLPEAPHIACYVAWYPPVYISINSQVLVRRAQWAHQSVVGVSRLDSYSFVSVCYIKAFRSVPITEEPKFSF